MTFVPLSQPETSSPETAPPENSPSENGSPENGSPENPVLKSPPKMGLHLKRPCVIVADLERSLTLYRDLLGFRLDYVGEASQESYLYKVFKIPSQGELKFAALSTDHEPRALALTEVKGVDLPKRSGPYDIGIVIQVTGLPTIVEQIQALNLEVVEPSYFTAPPDLTFTEQGFYDFDDHLVVLYEVKRQAPNPPSDV